MLRQFAAAVQFTGHNNPVIAMKTSLQHHKLQLATPGIRQTIHISEIARLISIGKWRRFISHQK